MEVNELQKKCFIMFEQRSKIEALKDELKIEGAVLKEQQMFLLDKLEELDLKKFDTGAGVITRVNKFNAKCVDKDVLFAYLRKRELLDIMASVNAMTLNSFYKTELELANENGATEFGIPGVEASSSFSQLKVTGTKKT